MWGSLRKREDRDKLAPIVGEGLGERDYQAIYVKRSKDADFFLVKTGIRTIYAKGEDEEWHDVYNWNLKLFVKEKPGDEFVEFESEGFLAYEEALVIIDQWTQDYPDRFYSDEELEEEVTVFPEWAQFIVGQALGELKKDNLDEIKSKISGTALMVHQKMLKQAYSLLDQKHELIKSGSF